jgi:multicomponent Na+:H+ antiporter subunit G
MTWVVQALMALGLFFAVMGNLGVFRFPDIYTRLHASSKCGTTSVFSILLGCMLLEGLSAMTGKIVAISVFFLITTPVASHVIGRCAWQRNVLPWRKQRSRSERG